MNKTAIKNFAIWARNKLIADIRYRASLMGITGDGIRDALQQSTGTTEFYDIGTSEPYVIAGDAVKQRKHLVDLIRAKERETNYKTAYKYVIEEVAYTWFNRLIAVRFMEVNDYLPDHVRVLSSESGKLEPDIVTTPFDAGLFFAEGEKQEIIQMKNENKLDEVFRILFIKKCRELSRILPRLFEGTNDYMELLLSVSFIDQEGVVYHLVQDIPEEDFNVEQGGQVEIIGWLYQFYNTEAFNSIFDGDAAKHDVSKELLPAATQLFTPDWVVRYMVENSLGRIWNEGHSDDSIKANWKYYIDNSDTQDDAEGMRVLKSKYSKLEPTQVKVLDPCMGSGHILVYAFDILMQIYESVGYTQRDAAKSILENNLFGLDIDDRAAQLAYFAVMMKARQYNRRILDGSTNCFICSIKESNGFDRSALVKIGKDLLPAAERLLDTFTDAKEYGSIIIPDISMDEIEALEKRVSEIDKMSDYGNLLDMMYSEMIVETFSVLLRQARMLVNQYAVIVTNPPYLGNTRYSPKLDKYIKAHYPDEKADLSIAMLHKMYWGFASADALVAAITTKSWMFINSFESFRNHVLDDLSIVNIVDFGTELFDGKIGHLPIASWIVRKSKVQIRMKGIRLSEYCYSQRESKEREFFNEDNYYEIDQNKLKEIPGKPIAYWVSEKMMDSFLNPCIGDYVEAKAGVVTGKDPYFIRIWEEIPFNSIASSKDEEGYPTFAPMQKGGVYRRHYGNNDFVLRLRDMFDETKVNVSVRRGDPDYYFKKGIGWSYVGNVTRKGFRIINKSVCGTATPSIYLGDEKKMLYILALLNSVYAEKILDLINPTINLLTTDICKVPCIIDEGRLSEIVEAETKNIKISKDDWDSFETSWDFKKHPLV